MQRSPDDMEWWHDAKRRTRIVSYGLGSDDLVKLVAKRMAEELDVLVVVDPDLQAGQIEWLDGAGAPIWPARLQ